MGLCPYTPFSLWILRRAIDRSAHCASLAMSQCVALSMFGRFRFRTHSRLYLMRSDVSNYQWRINKDYQHKRNAVRVYELSLISFVHRSKNIVYPLFVYSIPLLFNNQIMFTISSLPYEIGSEMSQAFVTKHGCSAHLSHLRAELTPRWFPAGQSQSIYMRSGVVPLKILKF